MLHRFTLEQLTLAELTCICFWAQKGGVSVALATSHPNYQRIHDSTLAREKDEIDSFDNSTSPTRLDEESPKVDHIMGLFVGRAELSGRGRLMAPLASR